MGGPALLRHGRYSEFPGEGTLERMVGPSFCFGRSGGEDELSQEDPTLPDSPPGREGAGKGSPAVPVISTTLLTFSVGIAAMATLSGDHVFFIHAAYFAAMGIVIKFFEE
jgi:hypothetical protein